MHLHFLTDDKEFEAEGHGKIEIVCHGCGTSILFCYDEKGTRKRYFAIRDSFRARHLRCFDKRFADYCPDYRSSVETIDDRCTGPKRKKTTKT